MFGFHEDLYSQTLQYSIQVEFLVNKTKNENDTNYDSLVQFIFITPMTLLVAIIVLHFKSLFRMTLIKTSI